MGQIFKYVGWKMIKKGITNPRIALMTIGAASILSFALFGC